MVNRTIRRNIKRNKLTIDNIDVESIRILKNEAKKLTDKRIKKKCTYKLWDLVVVIILATIANCDTWYQIEIFAKCKVKWLKTFLKMTGGIPTAGEFEYIYSIINVHELHQIFFNFVTNVMSVREQKQRDILSFDGKVDKRSKRGNEKPLNVLNVYSNNLGICIEQEMIDSKTNEIPAVPEIIERLNVCGTVATWDALNTQISTVRAVAKAKGDYVGVLSHSQL